jgi:hypothetical protein
MRPQIIAAVAEPYMPSFTDKVLHQLNIEHGNIPDTFALDIPAGHTLVRALVCVYDIASLYMVSFYCFVTKACARRRSRKRGA